ncbi:MAG: DNA polymerase III subunit delta' [Candidatus Lambdaproteobacteria bacterium]|nr:DNA polymerase III subunit delta' [Candidatus Lambdaproteobacteria bacterium]
MGFEAIRDQAPAIGFLRSAVARGRLPPAFLFLGPHHVGKRLTALALAKLLNCARGGEDSCGRCPPCRKIDEGVHPDVETVSAEGQFIRIDQIRAVAAQLALVPVEARRRVIVLSEAERMNAEAANAFLKTLEEPPPDTLIVLCAESTALLPATIVSRCVRVRFGLLAGATVRALLEADGRLAPDALAFAVAFAQGRLRPELRGGAERWLALRDEVLAALERLDRPGFEQEPERFAAWSDAEDWAFVLDWLETGFHDLALLAEGAAEAHLVNGDRRAALEAASSRFPPRRAAACLREVLATRDAIRLNANKALALEALWLAMKDTTGTGGRA